ncbi:MAG: response regulator [Candidatus Omnitrophica bacterium]|nr:response regulator [Candidatus Omnitrophota bacterium]
MEKIKVMIVDDEEDFLKITKINLEKTGRYEVKTMPDAADIVLQVKSFSPDIILLDILMPRMDGAEVCKLLKKDSVGGHIPIVTLSALDTDKDRQVMYKMGVVDFLAKPVEKDEIIAKIEEVLQRK